MATIKDVAKSAGVSTATVSRVLYGNYPVHEDTKRKVLDAVALTGYTANAVARSLKVNKTNMIGLLVPTIVNPYFMDFAKGIESKVAEKDYNMIFGSTDEDEEKEAKLLSLLAEKRVDAIVVATRLRDSALINRLVDQGTHMVVIDSYLSDLHADQITENDFSAAYKLLHYLAMMGHTKIAIIAGQANASTNGERFRAYRTVMEELQVEPAPHYILKGEYNRKKSYEAVRHLLEQHPADLPTALFATNNEAAEGAYIALKEAGLQIPEDMSLVSYGDLTIPGMIDLKLTHVRQTPFQMGEICGELLLAQLTGNRDAARRITVNLDIVLGDSVKKI